MELHTHAGSRTSGYRSSTGQPRTNRYAAACQAVLDVVSRSLPWARGRRSRACRRTVTAVFACNLLVSSTIRTKSLNFCVCPGQGVLAQYYSLPWVSFRDATWRSLRQNVSGFSMDEIMALPRNDHHPNDRGHLCAPRMLCCLPRLPRLPPS